MKIFGRGCPQVSEQRLPTLENPGVNSYASLFRPILNPKAWILILVMLLFTGGVLPAVAADSVPGDSGQFNPFEPAPAINTRNPLQFQYFGETGHSVTGGVLRYYRTTGGIARHGLPLSELLLQNGRYVQYFERSVVEFHPEYANTEREVTLVQLGRLETAGKNFEPVTPFDGTPDRWYFPATGHSLSGPFLTYWRNNGDEDALGLPLSEAFSETQPDGKTLTVQYFEYAKLEQHPENPPDYFIQLALLGVKRAQLDLKPAQLLAVPASKLSEVRSVRIPSLMFHYVRVVDRKKDLLGFNLSITPENFVKYLDWIKENGYTTVTIGQIMDSLKFGVQLPEKAINLRFDDGHADMWNAYQEMKKRGMTATFFVITRRLELLPEQWQQIDRDGFEVAAHTRTHPDLRGVKDLAGEITGSKLDLEAILGHPVRTFAYPYGKYSNAIIKVAQDSGFELAVSTDGGYNWTLDNMFKEPTISVVGDDNLTSFAAKIQRGVEQPPPAKK